MGADVLELADRLWRGEIPEEERHPWAPQGELVEVADGVAFVSSFANVSAFATSDGLVLVDVGSFLLAPEVRRQIRAWSSAPLHTAVYSHGHVDHVFGVPRFEEETAAAGARAPTVVAHEAVPARFDRYVRSAGYNAVINRRQFQSPDLQWPTEFRYPDQTYRDWLDLEIGGERFELHHARGETDDHTWTWVPARKVLCCGDLFTWVVPNAGNPQKVQRYPREWAQALRQMAGLGAEIMLPGHGPPLVGSGRVRMALDDSAALLESLHDQTLALMNEGASLEEIVHQVRAPDELLEKPYLRPVYDEPEFVVRNVWRLYGGWYDGDPAHLKPAPPAELAAELATMAGGPERLSARARELAEAGDLRLAGQLAEMAVAAAGDDPAAHAARADVLERRAAAEPSTMAKGVFASAARESRRLANGE